MHVQEVAQRKQSHAVMSELRSRGELLSDEQEKAALARLLGGNSAAVRPQHPFSVRGFLGRSESDPDDLL